VVLNIILYGKPGCDICDCAKLKLERMKLDYMVVNCTDLPAVFAVCKQIGRGAQSALTLHEGEVPLIDINGKVYDYPGAMLALKRIKRGLAEKNNDCRGCPDWCGGIASKPDCLKFKCKSERGEHYPLKCQQCLDAEEGK